MNSGPHAVIAGAGSIGCFIGEVLARAVHDVTVLRQTGVSTRLTTPAPPCLLPYVLRLPTPVVQRVAARILTVDQIRRSKKTGAACPKLSFAPLRSRG